MKKFQIITDGTMGTALAALNAAAARNVSHGGWCSPTLANAFEPETIKLNGLRVFKRATATAKTAQDKNIREATHLVIFNVRRGDWIPIDGVPNFSAVPPKKPMLVLDLDDSDVYSTEKLRTVLCKWRTQNSNVVINVVGPSEMACSGVYGRVKRIMLDALNETAADGVVGGIAGVSKAQSVIGRAITVMDLETAIWQHYHARAIIRLGSKSVLTLRSNWPKAEEIEKHTVDSFITTILPALVGGLAGVEVGIILGNGEWAACPWLMRTVVQSY